MRSFIVQDLEQQQNVLKNQEAFQHVLRQQVERSRLNQESSFKDYRDASSLLLGSGLRELGCRWAGFSTRNSELVNVAMSAGAAVGVVMSPAAFAGGLAGYAALSWDPIERNTKRLFELMLAGGGVDPINRVSLATGLNEILKLYGSGYGARWLPRAGNAVMERGALLFSSSSSRVGGASERSIAKNVSSPNLRVTTANEITAASHNASNANAQAALNQKMRALQKAQNEAVKTQKFSDGRVRYYMSETPSRTPGPTRGSTHVTEYNPKTAQVRAWRECYDHQDNVNRIHPKMIDGKQVHGQHYPPIKSELNSSANTPRGPK